ncbi:condensin [Ascobolus immersus RN42]|uniref:Condensin complex subunit 1 n=1 Tax=Ascobolus immersus RN42 TaxID=1160509 RepID=A0A3N4I4Z0_ASCIM|nr:condensin [Ascobolus immersus RN42]
MDDHQRIQFDLNQSLKLYLDNPQTIPTEHADSSLADCDDVENLSSDMVDEVLDPIIDAVASNPDAIGRVGAFDNIQCLLKLFPHLPPKTVSKVFDLIASGLAAEADSVHRDIEEDEQSMFRHHKEVLEQYGFLLQWGITALEARAHEKTVGTTVAKGRGKGAKAKAAAAKPWDPVDQVKQALDIMAKTLRVKLQRIFVTSSERDTVISLFTRPSYLILESEQRVKNQDIRMRVFKVLCLAVKHHGHAFGAQTSIVQNLSYFEHLAEPMAEFLQILSEQFDYPQLTDEILKEISNKEFNDNDTKGPKSISTFITRLSELAPRLVGKQIILLIKLLDSESFPLRQSIIEVCGNLITDLTKQDERSADHQKQLDGFFDILEERFLDLSPYVRARTIQVVNKLCDLPFKFPQRRKKITEYATRSLEDKSSLVRRQAVKLLSTLVLTHPFGQLHGGLLAYKDWKARLESVEAELEALRPPEIAEKPSAADETQDDNLFDEETKMDIDAPEGEGKEGEGEDGENKEESAEPEPLPANNSEELIRNLKLTKTYYNDAITFIEQIQKASTLVCQLLQSKTAAEVIGAMDFFCTIDAFRVETARVGTRRMLRLIWTKSNNDEGKGIRMHLIECYRRLFFEAPEDFTPSEAATFVARNMISLTFGTTPAELTSLEQLLCTMMKEGMVSDLVVQKLWHVYGITRQQISKTQRRGAIIVLGMLALAEPEIVVREMETIMRIGLGSYGKQDLALARYSCVALKYMSPAVSRSSENTTTMAKLPNDHAVLAKLSQLLEIPTSSKEWLGVAEQAISAIYALAKHPDVLCTEIIRRKTKVVFAKPSAGEVTDEPMQEDAPEDPSSDVEMSDAPGPEDEEEDARAATPVPKASPKPPQTLSQISKTVELSQLLFIVGHVAIKQIVHLELIEMEFKRRKAAADKAKQAANENGTASKDTAEQDELDLIGGTTEDDFAEAMAHVREKELLYGEKSLLRQFGPLVTEICSSNMVYRNRDLQAAATLCMAKLMCVSSEFCETNLPLLITIMERSDDPITRSNVVISLGDMAVCFNHLIDENTDFLYRRLSDPDASVKRTCLMTLTFLILAGQVKVKGQLGEMAKCLEDSDKRISDLTRMFFTELATKDNAVYNHFVDMFSLLTSEQNLDEEAFKRIIKFLASFIEKDKHSKQLADKLAARLQRCENERQWNDVAYALSLLQHKNEDIKQTIDAGFRLVQATGA